MSTTSLSSRLAWCELPACDRRDDCCKAPCCVFSLAQSGTAIKAFVDEFMKAVNEQQEKEAKPGQRMSCYQRQQNQQPRFRYSVMHLCQPSRFSCASVPRHSLAVVSAVPWIGAAAGGTPSRMWAWSVPAS